MRAERSIGAGAAHAGSGGCRGGRKPAARNACVAVRRELRGSLRGFTLLEVLVAVLLLGLALTALVRLAGLEARATSQLRESSFAQWVAANALAETRLVEPFPPPGRREGEATLAGRRWRWRLDVVPTDEPTIHRLEVTVTDAAPGGLRDEQGEPAVLGSLTGFAVRR